MKKRSRAVPLILLGTLSLLSGCDSGEPAEIKQSTYATREDCMNDWGQDERDCRPANAGSGMHYLGPRYYWFHGGGHPIAIDPDGSKRPLTNSYLNRSGVQTRATSIKTVGHIGGSGSRVSRGGFGGFSRSFSGGG
jgi:hypothetical protein